MRKYYILATLAFLAVVAVMAKGTKEIEETPILREGSFEEYGWTCIVGGDSGCSASCSIQKKRDSGYCTADNTCICN
ncbi:hypothetical protein KPH14_009560 [Odynerus spinipes]|uniref:Defensin n=1 Tax=Odynerus spinipes TaxID=1348599 RepID=A0AAD9VRP5_9HYME|nr:hypothetical protein KPH14_009560 [Odynerus spinipes]